MATPTPYGGATPGFYAMPDEDRGQGFDVPDTPADLPTMKPEDYQYFAPLLKETMPSHRLYQSFCFATGRITPDVVKTTTTTIPTATTKGGFVRVTSSSSLDEDALARRVRLVPMSRSLRMAVSALK